MPCERPRSFAEKNWLVTHREGIRAKSSELRKQALIWGGAQRRLAVRLVERMYAIFTAAAVSRTTCVRMFCFSFLALLLTPHPLACFEKIVLPL